MRGIKIFIITCIFCTRLFANQVVYFWSGAITSTSAKVNVVLESPSDKVRLAVASDKLFAQPLYSDYSSTSKNGGITAAFSIIGLKPNSVYYYCVEIDGTKDRKENHIGSFKTVVDGPYSFKFVAGSCNFFPNNRVYDKMRSQDPLFLMMPGDLHYSNPSGSDPEPHRKAYEELVLQQPRESKFLKDIPIAYVWDDHDFCGDNNDGTSGCGVAAYQAYHEYVPHYPFGAPAGSNAIYQAFTIGRIRFIMSDLRSERREGDIMSTTQKTWFKNEVLQAKTNGQIICWISSVSFAGTGSDNWGAYTSSREELSNFFRDNKIANLFIICGDAHMLAIDNGTHADFSTGANNANLYPILQSAALNNVGSDKGGVYSEGGTFPNPAFSSQWSTVEVIDNSLSHIWIRFICYRMNVFTKKIKVITQYEFCRMIPKQVDQGSNPLQINQNDKMLNLDLSAGGKLDVRILDGKGKLVHNQTNANFDKSLTIDATNWLNTGIYYVMAESEKKSFITSFEIK